MIVEQRDYHVSTGKLPELVRLYETEGMAIQQEILGDSGRRVHDRRRRARPPTRTCGRYESFADREERRAPARGGRALEGLPREDPAADPHPAEPDHDPDVVLAAALMGALDGKVAIVTGGAQGIGAAIARGLERGGCGGRGRRPASRPRDGIQADVSSEDGRRGAWSGTRSSETVASTSS